MVSFASVEEAWLLPGCWPKGRTGINISTGSASPLTAVVEHKDMIKRLALSKALLDPSCHLDSKKAKFVPIPGPVTFAFCGIQSLHRGRVRPSDARGLTGEGRCIRSPGHCALPALRAREDSA